jgi:uncharacterized protein (TIGR00369 family)
MADLLAEPPSPLDAAIGLVAVELLEDSVVLRLDPSAAAAGGLTPSPFLHGGTLATCVDTAGWYAVAHRSPGDWLVVDLRCDFLRLAAHEPHRVVARCLRAGRTLAIADVEIARWDSPDRIVAVGRAQYLRAGSRESEG